MTSPVIICSHLLQPQEGENEHSIRSLLRCQGGSYDLFIAFSGARGMHIRFAGQSTEYMADCYTSFVKTFEGCGYRVFRTYGAYLQRITLPQAGRKMDTSMDVISQFFHLPISQASKQLKICSTSLKKICRKHGLLRWPHRKVKSIDQKVARTRCQ